MYLIMEARLTLHGCQQLSEVLGLKIEWGKPQEHEEFPLKCDLAISFTALIFKLVMDESK